MPSQSASAGLAPSPYLAPGSPIGERFKVLDLAGEGPVGPFYLCEDEKTHKHVLIHLVAGLTPTTLQDLKQQVKRTMALRHRNLLSTYGVGTHEAGFRYIVEERGGGLSLVSFIAQRQGPVGLRAAFNIAAHVCKGLAVVHDSTVHGAIRPDVIQISPAGRVRIGELAISQLQVGSVWAQRLPEPQPSFLAPEVFLDSELSPATDIYGVGAVLFWLLSGRPPGRQGRPAVLAHPQASPEVEGLLKRCLATSPLERFGTTAELLAALLPLVAAAPDDGPSALGLDMDVEIDVDVAASMPPPAQASLLDPPLQATRPRPAAPAGLSSNGQAPPAAMSPSPRPPAAPNAFAALASPLASPNPLAEPAPPPPEPPAYQGPDLKAQLDQLTQRDSPRWMLTKDGMDHGPFTSRELIKQIVEGEALAEHILGDVAGGERKPLLEYPEFEDFVAQYRLRKAESDHRVALEQSSKAEKRSNITKSAILASGLLAVVIAGGTYFASRQAADEAAEQEDLDLAALYQGDEIRIEGTADVLKKRQKRARGDRQQAEGGPAPRQGGFGSYEDAMNQAIELGDATRGGGERQLRREDVAATMDRHLDSMFSCVAQERGRGGNLGNVRIDVAIRGSGDVMGASVRSGSVAFKSCILGKVRRIRFPNFPAPRMGAMYSFSAD